MFFFFRLDNQINFSLFRESKSYGDSLVVGKDNWLFEKSYLKEINEERVFNTERMKSKISRLKQLQHILKAKKIYFLLLIAPSKATVYSEFIPQRYLKNGPRQETVNYTKTKQLLDKNEINYLDGHDFFLQHKKDAAYDLFVKGGTHWSYYGASLFSKEVIRKIQNDTKLPIGTLSYQSIQADYNPQDTDRDLADLLNVFNDNATKSLTAHPVMAVNFPEHSIRPEVLLIGDSFMHTINKYTDQIFGNRDFYYYFKQNIPAPWNKERLHIPKKDQLKEIILGKDIVILESNEANFQKIGFGFIGAAVNALTN
ncbi:MAG: hypothetical protein D3923_13145 [Candidatus Electrothrix sp. AR3]|nr:hypothetical protein [Candidatus Electrothrix sp. AR3]